MTDSLQSKTDEELVFLSIANQEVYRYLILRYEKKLTRYLRRISNCTKEDTEDILQDIFIKAYQNLTAFDKKYKFSSWVYRIAHNEAISFYRKRRSRPQVISAEDSDLAMLIPSGTDMVNEVEVAISRKEILKVLNSLKQKYREVLVLKYFEEKDYLEISDILRKPTGTVATLLNRAKKDFKKEAKKIGLGSIV